MQSDEERFLGFILYMWGRRAFIIAGMAAGAILGAVYGLIAEPVYYSEAIISPKEPQNAGSGASSFISQLGGLGGVVAAQFGGGNANLDRMEILIRSRKMAEGVIQEMDLLPALFPKRWDGGKQAWKPGVQPSLREGVEKLRTKMISVSLNPKKKILTLGLAAHDSVFAARLVGYYLESLNRKIWHDVITEADSNRHYLEQQLARTADPLLREKIQNLMAMEIEKSMLVASRSFDVLESPAVPHVRVRPKRKQAVILGAFAGLLLSLAGAALWRVGREFRRRVRMVPSMDSDRAVMR